MENFIKQYYLDPITQHSGYNMVNTLTYAIIAIVGVYLIYRILSQRMKFDKEFVLGSASFILFAATLRVVTDSIDAGVFKPVSVIHKWILDSHIYDYGFWTVSPGVYIITFALFLGSLAILLKMNKRELHKYVGLGLWLPHFLLLVPFMQYAIYAIPVILLATVPTAAAYWYFKKNAALAGIVAGHSLDGAATFFAIDYFPALTGIKYFEQHVVSGFIGIASGSYFFFFLIKVGISFGAAYLLLKEKITQSELVFIAVGLMVMGFGPGIRDVLRMVVAA